MEKICGICGSKRPFDHFISWLDYKTSKRIYGNYCKHCRYEYGYDRYMRTNPEGMEDGIMGGRRNEDEEWDINYAEGYVELAYLAPEIELNFDWLNKGIKL